MCWCCRPKKPFKTSVVEEPILNIDDFTLIDPEDLIDEVTITKKARRKSSKSSRKRSSRSRSRKKSSGGTDDLLDLRYHSTNKNSSQTPAGSLFRENSAKGKKMFLEFVFVVKRFFSCCEMVSKLLGKEKNV